MFSQPACYGSESRLFVATPALLSYLGIDPATVHPNTDPFTVATVRTDEPSFP